MSQAMGCRPSDLLSLTNRLHAFYFDRAVWLFGSTLENELELASENSKDVKTAKRDRQRVLDRWFPQQRNVKGRFKDPATMF